MLGWVRKLFAGGGRVAGPAAPGIGARYDNAITTDENKRNWWAADYLSAKSANSFAVRRSLRTRSRYEAANNPFLYGVVTGNANDLVGTGPTLQVLTPDAAYNRAVERAWAAWAAEVELVEKLRTAKLARTIDGEGFLILKTVADLDHPVKLYPCDVEADQVTTPAPTNLSELWVDGLTLHPVTGRPTAYHVLRHHPGDYYFPDLDPLRVDRVSARHVIHWFVKFRPGQVRGIPVFTSSLDLFAELRAFRRAVLSGAELAADFAAVIEQDRGIGAFADEDGDTELEAFRRVPVDRRTMTTLPPGAKMNQFKPEQPTTSYADFQERCLAEACRPLGYPLVLALGTAQKFNFSSARLDFTDYRASLTVERADADGAVLDRMFGPWNTEAILAGAVPAYQGLDTPPPHEWHWPGFEPLDPAVDAQADAARLAAGTMTYREFWASRGYDWRDVLEQQAAEKKEIERLGLEFGEPAKKTVTEDGDPPVKKGPAEGSRRQPIRAYDESKVKRDDHGRFSETGSSHDSPKDLGGRAKRLAGKIARYGKKAVGAAKAVGRKAYELATHATYELYKHRVHADDIADTAHDYSKIINAKNTGDWLSTHLGVSGNTAAVVASHVLAYGLVKVKQAIAKRREKSESKSGTGRRGWIEAAEAKLSLKDKAAAVAELLAELYRAMGCPEDDLPTAAEVLAWLKKYHGKPARKQEAARVS